MDDRIFSRTEKLNFYDCGADGVIHLSSLMRMLGMTSDIDYVNRGMTHGDLASRGFAFLLSRESVHFNRPIRVGDEITFTTWEHKIEGPMFYRCFELFDENGESVASADTAWVLVDPATRKIIRPSNFTAEFKMIPEKTVYAKKSARIKHPADGVKCGEKIICYSDLDANGHMNNANYGSVAVDYLESDEQTREISDFMINFNHEAVLNDRLEVYKSSSENDVTVSAVIAGSGLNCFTAKIEYR